MKDSFLLSDDDSSEFPTMPTMRGGDPSTLGRIDHYDVLRKLGGGGFGVVYLARDSASGLEVALKTLHPLMKNNPEEMDNLREKFALASRLSHPNIATALVLHPCRDLHIWNEEARRELKLSAGDSVMVMRYAPGVTLSRWRRQFDGGAAPPGQALEIVRQIASALDYAHGEKIVHRDVKPGNIMVETRDDGTVRARLLDFGLAAEIRSSMSRISSESGDTSGTRPYMAPEQWQGQPQDGRTDQYALACVLYELLSGEPPLAGVFETGDPMVMRASVLSESPSPVSGIPAAANAALARALSKRPSERFPSCTAFVDAVERAVAAGRGRGWRARARSLALAAVALVAFAGLGAALLFPGRASRPGEPQGGGGLPTAVNDPTIQQSNEPTNQRTNEPTIQQSNDPTVQRSNDATIPTDGASVADLRAARTRALDALDARRERFEPDDSPESAEILAAVSTLDSRIAAALEAEETAAREAEEKRLAARATDARSVAQIARLKAAAVRSARAVEPHRKWNDGEFKAQFAALDKAKAALDALSMGSDLPAAKDRSAEIVAAAAWIEENAAAREEIDAVERSIDAMKADLDSAEAAKYAKAKLGAAEIARSDAARLRDKGRFPEAKAKIDESKRLYDEALASASAERAAAKAAEEVAIAEAAKIREDWDAVLARADEALRYQSANASALALKREAEAKKRKIAEVRAEAERKAREEAERKAAQGGASRSGEPQGGGGLPSAVGANGGLETAAPLAGARTSVRVGAQELFLRWCPPGSFQMGSPSSEEGRWDNETQHRVTLTKGFWMGETEVTQGLWKEVMGSNPSNNKSGDNYPVENVSWNDCQNFLRKLNAKAPAGWRFALPTEAQWEYACRAGTTGAFGGSGRLDDMGWFDGNSGDKTHPVAQKTPNAWGLYDMHGNVYEWCADWVASYPGGAATDPTGGASGFNRVLRGGCYCREERACRSADRFGVFPGNRDGSLGFRLLATVEPQRGGGLQSAVEVNGGLESAATLARRVTDNGHEGVQLWKGGPYWAMTNVGAERPEDYGLYFWWGDTVGYRRSGNAWVASDGSNRNFSFSEANSPTYGKSISKLKRFGWLTSEGVLSQAHDAAHAHWGGAWRMPTDAELKKLSGNCEWTWTTQNGSPGYLVRGRGSYSSASIFLPAAGFGYGSSLSLAGSIGNYRSSVTYESYSNLAWYLYFFSGSHNADDDGLRHYGQSVRPVQGFAN